VAFTYFISDIHLSESRQDITDCLLHFLQHEAPKAETLYVLGDLFEYWIGDDNITPLSQTIAHAFKDLSRTTPVFFIHGNRDFIIRKKWANSAGITLLPEQCVIDLYGTKTLLCHGDELCTLDVDYQKFRKKARSWWWPRLVLALPLSVRQRIAEEGRKKSQNKQQQLSVEIMDVTEHEVVKMMERCKVTQLIHGHTHRPNIHQVALSKGKGKRIVLGDWYSQGSIGKASAQGITLETRPFHD
jgi:UDP-2,3-diacylglucosamine hydrolase